MNAKAFFEPPHIFQVLLPVFVNIYDLFWCYILSPSQNFIFIRIQYHVFLFIATIIREEPLVQALMELSLWYHNLLSRRDRVSDKRTLAGGYPVRKFLVPRIKSTFEKPLLLALNAILKSFVHRVNSILLLQSAEVDPIHVLHKYCHFFTAYLEILAIGLKPVVYVRVFTHKVHLVKVNLDVLGIKAGKGYQAQVQNQENDAADI